MTVVILFLLLLPDPHISLGGVLGRWRDALGGVGQPSDVLSAAVPTKSADLWIDPGED